jgi:putative hydrolase of the HAD superfamily
VAVRRVAAVLLDAHGTLVELEPPGPALRGLLAARFGLAVSEAEAGAAIAAEIAYYRAHLDEGRDRAGLAALRARCAEVLRGALPQSDRLRTVEPEAMTATLLDALRFRLFDDVLPALGTLRAAGVALVVASNWDASLAEVLGGLGVLGLLDGVVTSAQAGASKPATAVFRTALVLAGAAPTQALHVGDRLDEDVAGARAAGIEPVLLRRDGTGGPPGLRTIASLLELPAGGVRSL